MQLESDKINLVASMLINHHEKIFKELAPPSAWVENPSFQTKYITGNKKSIQCFAQAGETVWTADSAGAIRVLDINVRLLYVVDRLDAFFYVLIIVLIVLCRQMHP